MVSTEATTAVNRRGRKRLLKSFSLNQDEEWNNGNNPRR